MEIECFPRIKLYILRVIYKIIPLRHDASSTHTGVHFQKYKNSECCKEEKKCFQHHLYSIFQHISLSYKFDMYTSRSM